MSRAWKGGSTTAHRNARAHVLHRDRQRCQLRLPGCTTKATHAHHTHGRATTGDDPRFMIAACEHCNLQLGDPTHTDPPPRARRQW